MTKKIPEHSTINLRVDLKDQVSEVFMELMEDRKFQTYAEAIRFCIMEAHNKAEYKLEDTYYHKIKNLLQYDYVKNELMVNSVQNFINRALDSYTNMISDNLESILSFDVRNKLSEEELSIALSFIQCQEENYANQVTVQELANKMKKRNIGALQSALDQFVSRGVLSKVVHDSEIYYHASPLKYS